MSSSRPSSSPRRSSLKLQTMCRLAISGHLYDYPVEMLAQLPVKIRKLILKSIPAADLHKMESTPVACDIDTSDCWTYMRKFFDDELRDSGRIAVDTAGRLGSGAKLVYLNMLLNSFYQFRSQSVLCNTLIRIVALPFTTEHVTESQMKACGLKISCSCHKYCLIPSYHHDFIPGSYRVTTVEHLNICQPIAFFIAEVFMLYDSITGYGCQKETWISSQFKIWQQQKLYLSPYWASPAVKHIELVCCNCRNVDAHESDLELISSYFTSQTAPLHFESLAIDDFPERTGKILHHFIKQHDSTVPLHTINRLNVAMRLATTCSHAIAMVIRSQEGLHTLELTCKFGLSGEIMSEILSLVQRPCFRGITLRNLSVTLNVSLSKFVYSQLFTKYFSLPPSDHHHTLALKNIDCIKASVTEVNPSCFSPRCTEGKELILEDVDINCYMFSLLHMLSHTPLSAPLKQLQLLHCQINLSEVEGFPKTLRTSELSLNHLIFKGKFPSALQNRSTLLNMHHLLMSPDLKKISFEFDRRICSIDQSQSLKIISLVLTQHSKRVRTIQKISFKYSDDNENVGSFRSFFDPLFSSFINLMNESNEGVDLIIHNSTSYELQWLHCIWNTSNYSKKFRTITCCVIPNQSIIDDVELMCEELVFL